MAPTRDHMTVLAPEGMLGYGIPVRSMEEGLARNPDVLAVDAGSTDPGPYYLGAGVPYTSRRAVKRDLAMMLDAAHARRIPVLIGSAGGGGGRPHLEWLVNVSARSAASVATASAPRPSTPISTRAGSRPRSRADR